MKNFLSWPNESSKVSDNLNQWQHPASNICLDFHGDPLSAGLVIFSDGNHHMALQEAVQTFLVDHPQLDDVFYATTPPGVLVQHLQSGGTWLGNLKISRMPDIFAAPRNIMQGLMEKELVSAHQCFAQSQGNVLLVKKGNPKNISSVSDLLRTNVTLFISNPHTEKASYQVYSKTLLNIAEQQNLHKDKLEMLLSDENSGTVFGDKIHHREAPQALYVGKADVAIVYYHLALRYCRLFPEEFEIIPLESQRGSEQRDQVSVRTYYHAGLLNRAENKMAGKKFIEFLLGDRGQAIYKSHGLLPAD